MEIKTDDVQVACLAIAHVVADRYANGDDDEETFQDYLKKFEQVYREIAGGA